MMPHTADTKEMTKPLLAARIAENVGAPGKGAPSSSVGSTPTQGTEVAQATEVTQGTERPRRNQ